MCHLNVLIAILSIAELFFEKIHSLKKKNAKSWGLLGRPAGGTVGKSPKVARPQPGFGARSMQHSMQDGTATAEKCDVTFERLAALSKETSVQGPYLFRTIISPKRNFGSIILKKWGSDLFDAFLNRWIHTTSLLLQKKEPPKIMDCEVLSPPPDLQTFSKNRPCCFGVNSPKNDNQKN